MALIDNCVAAYKLDETSWTSIHDEVSSSNWTLTNATQNSWWKLNYCTYFDGSGDYGTCPSISSNIAATNRVSVNVWVYRSDNNYRMIMIERQQSWSHYLNFQLSKETNNKIEFATYWANNTWWALVTSNNTIPLNTRAMVTATHDGSKIRVYINGTYENEATQTNALTSISSSNLMLWRNTPTASSQDFNGRLDEATVWSKTLSQAEITELYNSWSWLQYPFGWTIIFIPKIIQF
jgi:hypothetical protein